jgi:putative colanic acid biosynthesis UDP-glucose lipid carrier transferase
MTFIRGRYSWLLRPVLIIFDLLIINFFAYKFLFFTQFEIDIFVSKNLNNIFFFFIGYSIALWLISSFLLRFYEVFRYTPLINVFSLLVKQFLSFAIIVFAFIGFFKSLNIESLVVINYLFYAFLAISLAKILSYILLKTIRVYLKGNLRNVVIVGGGDAMVELKKVFKKKDLGYALQAEFSDLTLENRENTINSSFDFLDGFKNIDEIYCAIDELSEKEVNSYVKYANTNHCNIKFVPNVKKLFTKRLHTDYYIYQPVLSIREGTINSRVNRVLKRVFDVLFSLFVIIFILSWLVVLLFVIIKLESKGPLFYRHKRNGINYKEFYCYKFRSLKVTEEIRGTYVTQKDSRLTKVGKFLRKRSIDELPQFINVLLGDMSVVGPRPHMLSYTDIYAKKIDKYNFIYRHHVKPGISGLAQIKGFRGEVEADTDIINRIKYDIFYIENWSMLLDFSIIFITIKMIITGDEKAY